MQAVLKNKRWTVAGLAVLAVLAAVTVAIWPTSAADRAYDDGERLGASITDLRSAETYVDVNNALTNVRHAARDARDHAGDELGSEITTQQAALFDAVSSYDGSNTTGDEWDQVAYDEQYYNALDDLQANVEAFRSDAGDAMQGFWDGFQNGLDADPRE